MLVILKNNSNRIGVISTNSLHSEREDERCAIDLSGFKLTIVGH